MKRILEVIFFTSIMPLVLNAQNSIIKNIFTSGAAKWRDQVLKYFGQSTSVQFIVQSNEAFQLNGSKDMLVC
jgi:hypothetical protein